MSQIQVNSIVNVSDTGGPELSFGATIPAGQIFNAQGDVNISGIVTANNFVGNGSGLTGITIATQQKVIGFRLVFGSENNFRS
jgi:hypothetical protein